MGGREGGRGGLIGGGGVGGGDGGWGMAGGEGGSRGDGGGMVQTHSYESPVCVDESRVSEGVRQRRSCRDETN